MNFKTGRSKLILFSALVAFLVLPSLLLSAVGLSIPFGGRISAVIPCLFSGGNLLITQIPVAGPPLLILRPGISKLYAYYQPTPGAHILGTALGSDLCIIFPFPPVIVPAPLITMIGTSGVAGMVGGLGSGGDSDSSDSSGQGGNQTQNPTQNQNNDPCSGANGQSSSYITANEGWRNNMYLDSEGNRTIGVGHKITASDNFSSPISDSQVRQLYNKDYASARSGAMASAASHGVDWNSLSATRQTVLTDMAFNMGASGGQGLDGFVNMWSAIKRQDWSTAGREVYGSGYRGSRADRNSRAMANNDSSEINDRINSDQRARENCAG
ncbi:MAG: glycoside hydrolase family protein [Candidatus Paceibacterota bacterium]|jgi:GH24 family phage-related lysozyme (muramidase)